MFSKPVKEINAEYQAEDRYLPSIQNLIRETCINAGLSRKDTGAVFLVKKSDTTAQLRLLIVEPKARGIGIGKRLVDECMRFARQVGYQKIVLWTNDILKAARHIYEQNGFRLASEEHHHSFGHDLVGQYWEADL